MELLVAKDVLEHGAGAAVAADRFRIDLEVPRGIALGEMEEGQQGRVAAALDIDVVEAALPRRQPVILGKAQIAGRVGMEQFHPALAEDVGVAALVARMAQIEAPQPRIPGQLGGADEVAAAVGLDLGEAEQPQPPPRRIPPDPSLQRLEQRTHRRYSRDLPNIAAGGLPMPGGRRSSRRRAALAANLGVTLAGLVLIGLAAAAGQAWADRHFLPTFAWSRAFQIGLIDVLRVLLALVGLLLILFVRPRVARIVKAGRGGRLLISTLSASLAIVAALAATEGILHTRTWRATQERWGSKEPQRQRDDLLGWSFVPDHHGQAMVDGRAVDYATDRLGYRVAAAGAQTDLARPTIVFAGESIIHGYGLQWPETIGAQVQAMTGVAVANIAVNAHATDQTYMRLRRELPRFTHPVALIVPFVPLLFDRNLDQDRPYLDSSLRWHAAHPPELRLVELGRRILRYRSDEAIEEGVATTQAVLRATIALARSRGAAALILVPQFLPEESSETAIRRRVLDAAHLPYLLVPLDPSWRLAVDRHPDPRGARIIAAAIARALATAGQSGGIPPAEQAAPPGPAAGLAGQR